MGVRTPKDLRLLDDVGVATTVDLKGPAPERNFNQDEIHALERAMRERGWTWDEALGRSRSARSPAPAGSGSSASPPGAP